LIDSPHDPLDTVDISGDVVMEVLKEESEDDLLL